MLSKIKESITFLNFELINQKKGGKSYERQKKIAIGK